MTFAWRRRLTKICHLVFEIPPGCRSFWPHYKHEPLIIGLTLRFAAVDPWQARYHAGILEVERELRRVWSSPPGIEWPILREFCRTPKRKEGL
jgi:hypothetical protein